MYKCDINVIGQNKKKKKKKILKVMLVECFNNY